MLMYLEADAARGPLADLASGITPSGLERLKLDRLRELRAVVESLRAERELRLATDIISLADRRRLD